MYIEIIITIHYNIRFNSLLRVILNILLFYLKFEHNSIFNRYLDFNITLYTAWIKNLQININRVL